MEQLNNLKKLNDDIIRLSSRINKETSINKEQQKSYIIRFFNKLDKQLDKPIEDVINVVNDSDSVVLFYADLRFQL